MIRDLNEALQYIKENNIRMVDFKLIDIDGRLRHLTIPADRFNEDTMKYGIGFDASNYGYAVVEKSDMVFIPELSTMMPEHYSEVPTVSMLCNVCAIEQPDNIPFDQYPRNIIKAAMEYLQTTGIATDVLLGPEFEFFLLDAVSYETRPERASFSIENSFAEWSSLVESHGYQIRRKGAYHIASPEDFSYDLRSKICMRMEEYGIPVKYHHPEVGGPGQVEIEVQFGSMSEMADRTMMTKYLIKNEAFAAGYTATFMPKPILNECGSGMHVHIILTKDGKPVFYDADGYCQLSETALHFIGGLLTHAPSLCGFTNPSTNSYKRLVPGYEAPVTIGFAAANRSSIIRIPMYAKTPETKRFELRNPDATCNPYYAYAAILLAGLDGVKKKIDPTEAGFGPYDCNLFELPEEEKKKLHALPRKLEEALDALEADHEYLTKTGVFPEILIENWIRRRRQDAADVAGCPNPMEFAKYYSL